MTTRLRTGIGAAAAVVLLLDVFVVYGARVTHAVTAVDARRMYAEAPSYAGTDDYADRDAGVRPASGVYRYATSGHARIDRLGVDRRYPSTTVRVVRHGPGCEWSETVPILREHVETYTACSTRGDQLDTGFATDLTYFLVPGRGNSICSPAGTRTGAGRRSGEEVRFRCVDREHGVVTTGTTTYTGLGRAEVDGSPWPCREVRIVTVMSGSTQGAAVRDICADAVTGLVLAEHRHVGLSVSSRFVGRVTYTEDAQFRLLSFTPEV
ncbi:MAG TPA: hypothetical protein VNA14_10405 [Mycobacteriales bacterium]|nr:hypothetical protein [Mycobacteriales bacterium]